MPDKIYPKAPITEAVIEIRLAPGVARSKLKKISDKLARRYPGVQELKNLSVHVAVETQPRAIVDSENLSYRRASGDQTQVASVGEKAFSVSQLAPYAGWELFKSRFFSDYQVWKSFAGFQQITRVGMRFIDKIDVPVGKEPVRSADYLNIYPKMPHQVVAGDRYNMTLASFLPDIQCDLTIMTALTPAPLPGFVSLVLDIDLGKNAVPPQGGDDLMDLLSVMRQKKNDVFESCITERARHLFLGDGATDVL